MIKLKKFSTLSLCLALSGMPLAANAHLPTKVDTKTVPSLAPVLKQVTPSVVNIYVEKDIPVFWALDKNGQPRQINPPKNPLTGKKAEQLAAGTGVVVNSKTGIIITNAHVVDHAKNIIVTLKDGRRYRAKLLGQDNGFDIAVLKINSSKLHAAKFADSGRLQVGDFVAAIGSPFGLSQTVTTGVVSAMNRHRIEGNQNFIQTDASINPGNSGGPLINLAGDVVGINTAIFTTNNANIGIGFAIPSNMAMQVAKQLMHYGHVERGMLGVMGQNISPELADALNVHGKGVLVTEVKPDTPAEAAGIQNEDVIAKVNGNIIRDATALHNMFSLSRPGSKAKIELYRHGKAIKVTVKVGDPKHMLVHEEMPTLAGLRLQDFNELEESGESVHGALVVNVNENSEGELAGVIPGDVILQANHQAVASVNDLIKVAKHNPSKLLLEVMRGGGKVFLVVS